MRDYALQAIRLLAIALAFSGIALCLVILNGSPSGFGCTTDNCGTLIAGVPISGIGLTFYSIILVLIAGQYWRTSLFLSGAGLAVSGILVAIQAVTNQWCGLCLTSASIIVVLTGLVYVLHRYYTSPSTQSWGIPLATSLVAGLSSLLLYQTVSSSIDPVIIRLGDKPYTLSQVDTALKRDMAALDQARNDYRENWGYEQALLAEATAQNKSVDALLQSVFPTQPTVESVAAYKDYLQQTHDLSFDLPHQSPAAVTIPDPANAFVLLGPDTAPIKITMFSDLQCPFCQQEYNNVRALQAERPDEIQLDFRHFPLERHQYAEPLAIASLCAGEQGLFWEFLDKAFEADKPDETTVNRTVIALALDQEKFNQCFNSDDRKTQVLQDKVLGESLGVQSTPTAFVNGVYVNEPITAAYLASVRQ